MNLIQKYTGTLMVVVGALLIVGMVYVYEIGNTVGYQTGAKATLAEATETSRVVSERDQKVLAVILKRNPAATIKDFSDFPAFLVEESQRIGVDYRYVMAVIDKESEWNPRAVSPVGAIGLMQVMPETALIVVGKARDGMLDYQHPKPGKASPRYDSLGSLGEPRWSVRIGALYLKWKMDEFGLGPEHLRAYNRGGAQARAHWPGDRYAEDVAFKFVALTVQVPQ